MKTPFKFASAPFVAALALVGFGSVAVATAASPVLFEGPFGDVTSSTCGAAWDGDCEVGWNAAGADDSVKLVSPVGDPGTRAIMVEAGVSSPNTISKVFAVVPDSTLQITMPVEMLDGGTADFTVGVIFKASGGDVVGTTHETFAAADIKVFKYDAEVPAGAATARVVFALDNASSSDVAGVLGHVYEDDDDPALFSEGPSVRNPPWVTECKYYWGSCDCNISCPEGEQLIEGCFQLEFPICENVPSCFCTAMDMDWQ